MEHGVDTSLTAAKRLMPLRVLGLSAGVKLAKMEGKRYVNRRTLHLRIAPVIGLFFPLLRKHGKQLIPSLQHHHGGLAYWLRSLLDAIHDCRDKANALDWPAWNRNYF
jgi:hypothetical protein